MAIALAVLALVVGGAEGWLTSSRSRPAMLPYKRLYAAEFDEVGGVAVGDLADFGPGDGAFASQDWLDAWRSCSEVDYEVDVEGGPVPDALRGGTLFRAGPGNFERSGTRYKHVLDGDGFVLSLRFSAEGNRATVKGRFVKTYWFSEEEAAERTLFRNTFGTQPRNPFFNAFNVELKNVANTNAVIWGRGEHRKLLALWEAGAPHELCPTTLETVGVNTMGGLADLGPTGRGQPIDLGSEVANRFLGWGSAFTAHPHIDPNPRGGRLCGWAWNQNVTSSSLTLKVREFDDQWTVADELSFVMDGGMLAPHDWGLSPDYYVFFENQMAMDLAPFLLGVTGPAQTLVMKPESPVRVHIVPRPSSRAAARGERPRVLACPFFFSIHVSHVAQSADGQRLEIFGSGWPSSALKRNPDGSAPAFLGAWSGRAPSFSRMPLTNLFRTVVELDDSPAGGRILSHAPFPDAALCIEHPHVSPAFECGLLPQPGDDSTADFVRAARWCFMSFCNEASVPSPPQGWVRVDLQTGERKTHFLGKRQFAEELVLVPKGAGEGASSESVWLLGLAYHAERRFSALHVVDGDTMEQRCVLWLKHASPHGLHGSWLSGESRFSARSDEAQNG